jgi:C4-dicarboxylate transporter, DctM subunit
MAGLYGIPGITGAIFTPTEAAAVASIWAFIVANFIYRDMGPLTKEGGNLHLLQKPVALVTSLFHKDTRATLFEAGKLTITLMFIIANALILKQVLTDQQIPQEIAGAMLEAGFGKIVFLILVNVILLIGGQFMEPSGLILIVAPLVFPIAISLGVDPIHLGIIMVVNMEIGMITPPVGLNLFVTSGVAGMSMMRVVKAALPFLGVLFVFLIIVTYVPILSTWLPTRVMGPETIVK